MFNSYFQEILQVKIKINKPNKALDHLKILQQQIQLLKIENQRLESSAKADLLSMKAEIQFIKNQQVKEFTVLSESLQNLAIEKNKFENNFLIVL